MTILDHPVAHLGARGSIADAVGNPLVPLARVTEDTYATVHAMFECRDPRDTGPQIWRQTGGRVTHVVDGIGTWGTVTGTGEFLAEVTGGTVTVIGAAPENSAGRAGHTWYIESVGHFPHPLAEAERWPTVVDRLERIADVEALTVLHRLAREEGLRLGGSAGTAIAAALRVARTLGPEDVVVVIVPDAGRAQSKYYDDAWLGRLGFPLYRGTPGPTVAEMLVGRGTAPRTVPSTATVAQARDVLADTDALPVVLAATGHGPTVVAEILGSVSAAVLAGAADTDPVESRLEPPLPVVGVTEAVAAATRRIGDHRGPVVVAENGRAVGLVAADVVLSSTTTGSAAPRKDAR
ncbi:pyridoxal-phosphate dependent enzyme [Rhodococcus sp. NPDC003318]|uniref:pyridoxal-phosphate dependent enzyme n=1 Tax=Rhodococcus sp. NPDC003318 TaxID=3364503 RepID=UPI0036AACCA5